MYQDIKRNKIKTGFIISIYIVVITLIIYYNYLLYMLCFRLWNIFYNNSTNCIYCICMGLILL